MNNETLSKGQKTKQRILEVSAVMFWKNSYHSVRIDKIVKEAKVNKASFYQYFTSKEQAAFEGIKFMHKKIKNNVFDASVNEFSDPYKRLEGIFTRIYNIQQDFSDNNEVIPGCPFVNMGNEMASDSHIIRQVVEQAFDCFCGYHQIIVEQIQKDKTNKSPKSSVFIARQIQGVLNGSILSAKLHNNANDILDGLDTAKLLLNHCLNKKAI